MTGGILEADRVSFTYPDSTPSLREVSFRIVPGEAIALLGANGAGKSTLLLHLSGCLFPQDGVVRIGGDVFTAKTAPALRRLVGMVFQDPDDQLFMPTVLEDVVFGPLNLGMSAAAATEKAEEVLSAVGALHLKDRPPYKLSGGEKRAVSIASVLALSPEILVMDEPSSNLDARSRRRLIVLLKSFSQMRIVATHDLEMALEVCRRVLVLHEGQLVADGPPSEILKDEALLARCGLEVPLSLKPCATCGARRS